MVPPSNQHGESLSTVLEAVLDGAGEALVVDPSAGTVEQLVAVLGDGDVPTVRVLAREGVLRTVEGDFLVASSAAELVAAGDLELRTGEGADNTLVVTDEAVFALVAAGEGAAALAADDPAFVGRVRDAYGASWDGADAYELRTPSIDHVRETLESEMGPETRADFEAVLSSLETARGDEGPDEVAVSLLVAAKNEQLLYDISGWGEDAGIASKATFSRTKSRLEDLGLIDTEKVPIDVGRPRLRLKLADERLEDADAEQLASVAASAVGS